MCDKESLYDKMEAVHFQKKKELVGENKDKKHRGNCIHAHMIYESQVQVLKLKSSVLSKTNSESAANGHNKGERKQDHQNLQLRLSRKEKWNI